MFRNSIKLMREKNIRRHQFNHLMGSQKDPMLGTDQEQHLRRAHVPMSNERVRNSYSIINHTNSSIEKQSNYDPPFFSQDSTKRSSNNFQSINVHKGAGSIQMRNT